MRYVLASHRVAVYVTEHPAYTIYRDGGRAADWASILNVLSQISSSSDDPTSP